MYRLMCRYQAEHLKAIVASHEGWSPECTGGARLREEEFNRIGGWLCAVGGDELGQYQEMNHVCPTDNV
jgi:hypothetical protein